MVCDGASYQESSLDAIDRNTVDVNIRDRLGQTPLYMATSSGNEKLLKRLLATGASISIASEFRLTPLHDSTKSSSFVTNKFHLRILKDHQRVSLSK